MAKISVLRFYSKMRSVPTSVKPTFIPPDPLFPPCACEILYRSLRLSSVSSTSSANSKITYKVIRFLIGVRDVAVRGRRLLVVAISEDLLLLGDLLADAVDATDTGEGQVAVGRVGEPRGVRGVGRVARAEVRVVHRHDDRAVLLGHRRDRVRVVGVRQVLLGIQVCRQHEGLPVAARRYEAPTAAIPYRKLVAATAAAAQIER